MKPSQAELTKALVHHSLLVVSFGALFVLAQPRPSAAGAAGASPPTSVQGERPLLVVAVEFPDVPRPVRLSAIERKAEMVGEYVRAASYGKLTLTPRVVGWYRLPEPIARYRVSPYNYQVDRQRVEKLLVDALSAARRDVRLADFKLVWVVVGARTAPGEGYGMIAYAANPGMLSQVRGGRAAMRTITLPGGGAYSDGAIVSAFNAHLGHVAHDLLHALGGVSEGRRVVPDLYDFDLQSDPSVPRSPASIAIHAGPWDVMSQHLIDWPGAPPPPSSFTRLRLGWIAPEQVVTVTPGDRRDVTLKPLVQGKGLLVVRIPLGRSRYLLLENRQNIGGDSVLPDSGLVVLEVDTDRPEGAGIVRVIDAEPAPLHSRAPFRPDKRGRGIYQDRAANVRVAPLEILGDGAMTIRISAADGAISP